MNTTLSFPVAGLPKLSLWQRFKFWFVKTFLKEFFLQAQAQAQIGAIPREVTKARRYPMGFPETELKPGDEAQLVVCRPQIPYRVEHLIIPENIAEMIEIVDIRVGKNSQMPTCTPLPAFAFTEKCERVALHFDVAQISQNVAILVKNKTHQTVQFKAVAIGSAIE